MVVHEIITAHFGGHIGPLSRPYQTTFEAISDHFQSHIGPLWKVPRNLEIPGNGAAIAVIVVDIMVVVDSMIYNDHFY